MTPKKFWTCKTCGPRGVHHYKPSRCRTCGGSDLVETIRRPSLAAMINHAVADDDRPKRQGELFDFPMA